MRNLDERSEMELVGIRLKDGETKYVPWVGNLDRRAAVLLKARWVKLIIHEITPDGPFEPTRRWTPVTDDQMVLGCVMPTEGYLEYVAWVITDGGKPIVMEYPKSYKEMR